MYMNINITSHPSVGHWAAEVLSSIYSDPCQGISGIFAWSLLPLKFGRELVVLHCYAGLPRNTQDSHTN